jgi:4-amino-4-deoxy-L-arabinose transferase-like glycosyltransferase
MYRAKLYHAPNKRLIHMNSIQTPLIFFGALLCLCAGQLLFNVELPIASRLAVQLGVGLHLLGGLLAWRSFRHQQPIETLHEPPRRWELLAIGLLMALAAALRLLWLETLPFRIDGDAAAFAAAADDFLRPNPPPLIGTGWQSHTNLYFFLESLSLRVFGYSALGLRFFGALGGTLSVLAIYALGRSLWNFWVGFWAALIMAVLPFHLVFSRVGTEVIHVSWMLPLVTWSIWRGWRGNDWRFLLLGGAVTGLSQYFYPGARLIPILAIAQIGLLLLLPAEGARQWRRGGRALLWLLVGGLAIYGPMIPYFMRRPEIYSARIGLVSIFSGSWLAERLAEHPWWFVLGDQLRRAYLPFVFPVDGPQIWYVWPQYLGPLDAALLVLGLIIVWAGSPARWLKLFLAIYLGLGMFLAGVVTIDTPMPSRYVIFLPAVALCIGCALERLVLLLSALPLTPRRSTALGLALGAVSLYLGSGVASYLKHDTEAIWDIDQTGQTATYAARYLRALPEQEYEIFFLQTEWMYYEASPVLAFLTDKPGLNIKKELDCSVMHNVVRQRHSVFIAPRERIPELERIRERLPAATLEVLTNPQEQQVVGILQLKLPGTSTPFCVTPDS